MEKILNGKKIIIATVFGVALLSAVMVFFLWPRLRSGNLGKTYYSEVDDLRDKRSFDELKTYFEKLSEEKGARYAFGVLKVAPMPPNIDMHLLGHAVGDMLYKQEGLKGIEACTDDFRNACSHSIVVGLFFDKGESALEEIAEACRRAPGGQGAYTMCFHGLGHGVVSALGYDVPKAVGSCQKTGTGAFGHSESVQCTSGIVMEMVGGGGHDRDLWAAQRKKFMKPDKPLGFCQNSFIPERDRYLCYVYLTPFLWESVGADLGFPSADDFKRSFPICNTLAVDDGRDRDACFGGFGKEFVGLVQSRDIRKGAIGSITDQQLAQVYQWCKLADNKEGTAACIVHAMNSLYWGGENDPKIATRFCGVMSDEDYNQGSCYTNLIGSVSQYVKDSKYRQNFCNGLPSNHQGHCRERLLGLQ